MFHWILPAHADNVEGNNKERKLVKDSIRKDWVQQILIMSGIPLQSQEALFHPILCSGSPKLQGTQNET